MKNISLKLDDDVFTEMEKIASRQKISINRYINEAVNIYNLYNKRQLLKKKLRKESLEGTVDSMNFLKEIDGI